MNVEIRSYVVALYTFKEPFQEQRLSKEPKYALRPVYMIRD